MANDAEINIGANTGPLDKSINDSGKKLEEFAQKADKAAKSTARSVQSSSKAVIEALRLQREEQRQLTLETQADTAERIAAAKVELAHAEQTRQKKTIQTKGTVRRRNLRTEGEQDRLTIETKTAARNELETARVERDKELTLFKNTESLKTSALRRGEADREKILRQAGKTIERFESDRANKFLQLHNYAKAAGQSPSQFLFGGFNQALAAQNTQYQLGVQAQQQGIRPSQVWQQMMNAATARNAAANAVALNPQGAAPPASGGGGVAGIIRRLAGGGGGGIAGSLIGGLASGVGIGLGGYAIANMAKAAIEAAKTATAYERQMVAAKNLAGGQENLNAMLKAYTQASGGAVSKTEALNNVTRLLATGIAKTVPEVAKLARGTRGASVALGRPEEEIVQQTQLAIANTSQRRLDQIGLGIGEVTAKIKELRKQNAGWSRENAFGEAVLVLLDEKYGKLNDTLEGQKTGLERLAAAWDDLTLAQGKNVKGPVNQMAAGLAGFLKLMQDAVQGVDNFQQWFAKGYNRRLDESGITSLVEQMDGRSHSQTMASRLLSQPKEVAMMTGGIGIGGAGLGTTSPKYVNPNQDAIDKAKTDAYLSIEKLHADTDQRILSETANFNRQRENAERNYQKSVAREEEDFARSRARSLRDYEKSIVDMMRDAQQRDAKIIRDRDRNIAEIQSDTNDKIAEMRDDSNKKLVEAEKEYQENREKAAKDHADRLMAAAGRLDALAIYQEQKNWRKENEENKKAHDKNVQQEKDALAERIDDARKAEAERIDDLKRAADEQLADAHEADNKRLEDMRAARKQQQEDEDEDRRIAKGRAAQDHDDEMKELERQHNDAIAEINRQAAAEEKAIEDALVADLASLGEYMDGYLEMIKKRDEAVEKWFEKFWDRAEKVMKLNEIADTVTARNPDLPVSGTPGFARGGRVNRTGPAILHAGEYVLSRNMLASGYHPGGIAGASYNNSSKSIVVQDGAISIQVAPGQEEYVGRLVHEQLTAILEEV